MNGASLQDILLVEDDERIRRLARTALVEIGGFDVETLSTGRDIIETLESVQSNLVLLDVMMPEVDGREVLVQLDEDRRFDEIPVVLFTAKVKQSELNRYQDMQSVAGVIEKPFDTTELPDRLREIWRDFRAD
jgi:CheY-like chemotaxis protein